MTHLLISQREIESWIESLDMQELDLNEQIYVKDYIIEAIKKFSISLEDIDIEKRATELNIEDNANAWFYNQMSESPEEDLAFAAETSLDFWKAGYKQSLEDLKTIK